MTLVYPWARGRFHSEHSLTTKFLSHDPTILLGVSKMNSNLLKLVSTIALAISFLGATSCSKDSDSSQDKDKGSIFNPGKQPTPTGGGKIGTELPADTTLPPARGGNSDTVVEGPFHPINGPEDLTNPGTGDTGEDTGSEANNGTTLPGNGNDSSPNPDNGTGSNTDPDNNNGNATGPSTGEDSGSNDNSSENSENGETPGGETELTEEQIFALITEAFETYLPRGIYKGKAETGNSCQITVKPFAQPGKDLVVEIEASSGSNGAGNDKLNFTLAPGQGTSIAGLPRQDPPAMRMWAEIAVPNFSMSGMSTALKLLSVKFDPTTKEPQKVYIFDQTREGLGNTSVNCAIESFEPEVVN